MERLLSRGEDAIRENSLLLLHFAGISVPPLENIKDAMDTILSANEEGFSFKPVSLSDVIITISHFSSQARGADGAQWAESTKKCTKCLIHSNFAQKTIMYRYIPVLTYFWRNHFPQKVHMGL